jgi:CubicO group peptidase (beta-lactamase class C family)
MQQPLRSTTLRLLLHLAPCAAVVDLSTALERAQLYNANCAATRLERARGDAVKAYALVRGGRLVAERYAQGTDDSTHTAWSVTKSWTSLLIGVLVDAGSLSTSTTLEAIFAGSGIDWGAVTDGAHKKEIRLDELLTMSSGLSDADSATYEAQDTLLEVLNHNTWSGSKTFSYLTSNHILAYVIYAATGQTPEAFALGASGVFGALAMVTADYDWTADLGHSAPNAE